MTLSQKDRRYILASFLDTIFAISNKDYQQRVWIEGIGPECDDYDESTNFFFEYEEIIAEELDEYHLTDEQIALIQDLKKEFEDFGLIENSFWPPYFIDTPEWERVGQKAKLVLKAFNYKHKSFEESSRELAEMFKEENLKKDQNAAKTQRNP